MKHVVLVVSMAVCLAACLVFAQTVTVEKVEVKVSAPKEGAHTKATPARAEKKAEERVIRFISSFDTPPFSFRDGMKKTGLEIDLAEALAKNLGKRVEWIDKNFSIPAYTSALDAGSADAAIASITVNEERKESLDFTTPYFATSLAVAVRNDFDWRHTEFENGLKGWLVGVMRGTTGEEWARKHITGEIKTYASNERLIQELGNARPNARFCIIADEALLVGAAGRTGYRYKIVEKAFSRQRYAIAVRKGNTELLNELNGAFETLHANGEYDKIFHKWYEESEDLPLAGKYE